ncbi:MAG: oligosaccharide flippase family protein [Dehalococcoidia bacterium]
MTNTSPTAENQRGFLFNVNLVFLSQIAIYGFAFGIRVVLARGLGDSGLGTYALFFTAILVAGGIANLGVGLGNIYFLNKGTHGYRVLLSNSIALIGWTALAGWLFVGVWAVVFEPELFVSGGAYWLYAAALPAVVAYTLLTSFLHGSSRFVALTIVAVTQGAVSFVAVGLLWALDELDVATAIAAWTASFAVADLLCLTLVGIGRIDPKIVLKPRWRPLKDQVVYGIKGQAANMAALFNYRLDQFLVAAFISRAAVGHYTVAVGLAESVWWLSSAVAVVMLPKLTAMDEDEAQKVTPIVARNTLLISALAAIGVVVVSPLAIQVLFGEAFYPEAFLPLVLLMPGIVAASATRVLGSYLFSRGRVIYNTYATFIALGVTVGLDLVLIPVLDVEGAAIASSIAYTFALIATVHWYRNVSGRSAAEALIWSPSDIGYYARALRRVFRRIRSG